MEQNIQDQRIDLLDLLSRFKTALVRLWPLVLVLAIVLSGAAALLLNAGKAQYSLIDATNGSKTKRPAQVYLVAFVLVGYIVFWAAIRNGIVDTAEYIQSYQLRRTNVSLRELFNDENVDAPLFIFFQVVLKR